MVFGNREAYMYSDPRAARGEQKIQLDRPTYYNIIDMIEVGLHSLPLI